MKTALSDCYNDQLIEKAEQRRQKLNYTPIHVGLDTTPRLKRILKLLYEAHQNYYFGYFEATCALGVILLEQAVVCLLEEKIENGDKIKYTKEEKLLDIGSSEFLIKYLDFADIINVAINYHFIDKKWTKSV